jgi:hypothetical protein
MEFFIEFLKMGFRHPSAALLLIKNITGTGKLVYERLNLFFPGIIPMRFNSFGIPRLSCHS